MDTRTWLIRATLFLLAACGYYALYEYRERPYQDAPFVAATLYFGGARPAVEAHKFLVERLKENGLTAIREFQAGMPNDLQFLRACCEALLQKKPDVIVSIGANCSKMLTNLQKKRKYPIPTILLGVSEPIELGIVDNLEKPGRNITGVFTRGIEDLPLGEFIHTIWPHSKGVLIPYYNSSETTGFVRNRVEAACDELEKLHVPSTALPIDNLVDVMGCISAFLDRYDVVACLEADAVGSTYMTGIAKRAKRYEALVIGGDLQCAHESHICYGTNKSYCAYAAADMAKRVSIGGEYPGDIPFETLPNTRECKINKTLLTQLTGDEHAAEEMKQRIVQNPALGIPAERITVF